MYGGPLEGKCILSHRRQGGRKRLNLFVLKSAFARLAFHCIEQSADEASRNARCQFMRSIHISSKISTSACQREWPLSKECSCRSQARSSPDNRANAVSSLSSTRPTLSVFRKCPAAFRDTKQTCKCKQAPRPDHIAPVHELPLRRAYGRLTGTLH